MTRLFKSARNRQTPASVRRCPSRRSRLPILRRSRATEAAATNGVQDLLKLSVMLCPKAVSPPTSGSPAVEPRLRQPAHCRQDAPRRAREGRWCGLPRVSCRAGLLLWWFDFARAAANVAAALASPIAFLTDANCDADKGFFASATTCNAGSCSLAMAFRAQCFCWHLASCARHLPSLQ